MGFNSKTQKRKMKLLAALTALTSAIDPLMLMMMSGGMGGGGMDIGSNPILLLQLLKGDSGSSGLKDLLPLMMMSGGMGGGAMGAGGMQSMLPLLMLMGDDDSSASWTPKPASEYADVCAKIVPLDEKATCEDNFGKIYSGCTVSDVTSCSYVCAAAEAAADCEATAKTACKAIVGDSGSSDSGMDDDLLLMMMMMGGMPGMTGGASGAAAPMPMDPMMAMTLLGR